MSDGPYDGLLGAEARRRREAATQQAAIRKLARTLRPQRTRVFVSFDFDKDVVLAKFLVQQLAKSPRFSFEDWSLKEAAPIAKWQETARARIDRSHLVMVVLGDSTHRASGVLREVAMARTLRKPVCQLVAASKSSAVGVPRAGRRYRWSHSNLETILADVRRRGS